VHPILAAQLAAAGGAFPAADGTVAVVEPLAPGWCGVASFTGHAYVATSHPATEVAT